MGNSQVFVFLLVATSTFLCICTCSAGLVSVVFHGDMQDLAKVGDSCSRLYDRSQAQSCVPGALCYLEKWEMPSNGVCKCDFQNGFRETVNKTCEYFANEEPIREDPKTPMANKDKNILIILNIISFVVIIWLLVTCFYNRKQGVMQSQANEPRTPSQRCFSWMAEV